MPERRVPRGPAREHLYGRQAVHEALRGPRAVERVWCSERARVTLGWLPTDAHVEPPERLERLAGSADHQGVVAEVEPYRYAAADGLLGHERALVVALDEVQDPQNVGAVARVVECAGGDGLLLTRRRSAGVTPAVCRASAGAIEHLPVALVENLADTLIAARRPGLWSYAAAGEAERSYDAHDYRDGTLFVLGAEGRGVRPRVRAVCDEEAAIPMHGRIGSLNVSTAAAVLVFEAVRQRRGG